VGPSARPDRSDHWDGLLAYVGMNRSWIDGVVVDGPDPTGDPDLTSLLAALADAGIPARLVTQGMDPGVLAHAIAEQLVTSISLEVRTVPERLAAVTGLADAPDRMASSVAVLVNGDIDHDFHTAVDLETVTVDELPSLAASLRGGRLYAIEPDPRSIGAEPSDLVALRAVARACCASLPTIVRDAG
jgi:pyruvate formate lyase activating enzyme